MTLNVFWIIFFLLSFVVAVIKLLMGDTTIFKTLMDGVFDATKTGVDIAIVLTGVMSLFLGFMRIGERAGAINFLSRLVSPLFSRLFPDLPKRHPAMGHMMMNFSANMLGLDNAATPFALKAMKSLQELNPQKDTASNAQIMFMVLHASGLTIIPVSIIAFRYTSKIPSHNPTEIFIPCVIGTFVATMVAMGATAFWQKFKWEQWKVILIVAFVASAILAAMGVFMRHLSSQDAGIFSNVVSNGLILLLFIVFILGGIWKKVNVYDAFISGAKEGLFVAVRLIPYLIAILVAISLLRTSGVFTYFTQALQWFFGGVLGLNTDFVPAMPTALMKPFSGNGARGMMISVFDTYGPDSFAGRLASIFHGSADSTFYIVAVYFGSVGIRKTRYAIPAALLGDLAGVIAAIFLAYNWPWSS